jgi:SNF2 family DNA or RNA helicase
MIFGLDSTDFDVGQKPLRLHVIFEPLKGQIELTWIAKGDDHKEVTLIVRPFGPNSVQWTLHRAKRSLISRSSGHLRDIRSNLRDFAIRFPVRIGHYSFSVQHTSGVLEPIAVSGDPLEFVATHIRLMERQVREYFKRAESELEDGCEDNLAQLLANDRSLRLALRRKEEERRLKENARRDQILKLKQQDRAFHRERQKEAREKTEQAKKQRLAQPMPDVEIVSDITLSQCVSSNGESQHGLAEFLTRERASSWWIANQTDELLCLPHCDIEHHDYQVRAALRAMGALRGRALLCDEVGLGKTIEAGLVLKELMVRGMVSRFLVITMPSLVDQWCEELRHRFKINAVSTNDLKPGDSVFWKEQPGIVSSLHILKSPQRLEIAEQVKWDLVIVDEAHHLRNRTSAAWGAINRLTRQFMLLLTATPIQNNLDDLYNLVTLLKPGQLPAPAEFRKRFVDKENSRKVNDAKGLRDLLRAVMIRNTRANAQIDLPARHAETVLFEADEIEQKFWLEWEKELRRNIVKLPPLEAAMRTRTLLQAAGSSPSAWRDIMIRSDDLFNPADWLNDSVSERSWEKKWRPLILLAKQHGGVVVFTQFRRTQQALADALGGEKASVFVIDGSVPAPKRTGIVNAFHEQGGALILTRSGSEGRNLQFSHQIVNFDLPWNPMEIEQRIGRLHRMGQKHPVQIFNFVRAGSLQEQLLNLLQEKLNLFELVVGETGLVLGDRYSGDEFSEAILEAWKVGESGLEAYFEKLGEELVAARSRYQEIQETDQTLFARDFEML